MPDALLVTSSFLPGRGGIETHLAELCAAVRPRVAVLAPSSRDGKPIPRDLAYPSDGVPASALVPGRGCVASIERTAARHGVDRVLLGTPWPLAVVGPRLKRKGYRYAVHVYGAELIVPSAVPGLRRALIGALAEADVIFAISDYTARWVRKLLDDSRPSPPPIEVLYPRVDTDRFHPDVDAAGLRSRLGLDPGDKVIVHLGRLVRRKGAHRLIDALTDVRRRVPNAVLVVGGTGPEDKRLRALAARKRAPVVFAGSVADHDASSFYALGDVFAFPVADRWFGLEVEGLGVVLLEAAACGLPSVVGSSGGSSEAVVDGETGFVIDGRDRHALAGKLAWLLENTSEASLMGKAGRARVEGRFSSHLPPKVLLDWLG